MSQLQLDQAHLRSWVGRTETMTDVIDPGKAAAMAANQVGDHRAGLSISVGFCMLSRQTHNSLMLWPEVFLRQRICRHRVKPLLK